MSLRVEVDPMKCQAYGLCLDLAPGAFDIPEGAAVAVALRATFDDAERAPLLEAQRNCPAQAISVAAG